MTLINTDSPAGQAFSAFCEGALDISALSPESREEFASCARMWLDIPAIAEATGEDAPLPSFLRSFVAALEAEPTEAATDQPITDQAYSALVKMGEQAVDALSVDEFTALESSDMATDQIVPEVFGEALNLGAFAPFAAVDISDAVYEGVSTRYAERWSELADDGLI